MLRTVGGPWQLEACWWGLEEAWSPSGAQIGGASETAGHLMQQLSCNSFFVAALGIFTSQEGALELKGQPWTPSTQARTAAFC